MKISVAMATFNGEAFLTEQIDTIIGQTRPPDEIVVCDDQSSDGTAQILESLRQRSPIPMRIVINDQRLKSTKNFEKAISLCDGDIIALADQDDVWLPHKLEAIEKRFAEEPDLGLVFSDGYLIDEKGARLRGTMWSRFLFRRRMRKRMDRVPTAYDLFLSHSFMTGATMAFRSEFRSVCLPIPDGISTFIHDRWISVLIAAVARVGFIEDKLVCYRIHPQQQMGVGKVSLLEAFLTPAFCTSDDMALASLAERLEAQTGAVSNSQFNVALKARKRHTEARIQLPTSLVGRTSAVMREYIAGHYQRYPYGQLHALRDLLVGTR